MHSVPSSALIADFVATFLSRTDVYPRQLSDGSYTSPKSSLHSRTVFEPRVAGTSAVIEMLNDQVNGLSMGKLGQGQSRAQHLGYGLQFPERAVEAVNRFSRQMIGLELLKMRGLLLPTNSKILPALLPQLDAAAKTIEEAQQKNPGYSDFGQMAWVLGRRPSDHSQEWVKIGFDPVGNKLGLTMYFPQTGIGSDWPLILQAGEHPESIVYPYDWADFCIPQLAFHSVGLMYGRSLTLDEATDAIEWRLSRYQGMGLP